MLVVVSLIPRSSPFFTLIETGNLRILKSDPDVKLSPWLITGPFAVIFPLPDAPDTFDRKPTTGVKWPEWPAITQIDVMTPLAGAFSWLFGDPISLLSMSRVHAAVVRSESAS